MRGKKRQLDLKFKKKVAFGQGGMSPSKLDGVVDLKRTKMERKKKAQEAKMVVEAR